MKLREFGLTKKFIKDMEIDIYKAPMCPCGCGGSAYISLENSGIDEIISLFISSADCPKTLAIVKKYKKTFFYFRSDLMEKPYDNETITCCCLKENANITFAVRDFITKYEIHHVGIFDYGTFHNSKILNVIEN